MEKTLTLFLSAVAILFLFSCSSSKKAAQPYYPFTQTDAVQELQGFERSFKNWVLDGFKVPSSAIGYDGIVKVHFILSEEGRVTNIKVVESPHPALSGAIVAKIKKSPKWYPATYDKNSQNRQCTVKFEFGYQ